MNKITTMIAVAVILAIAGGLLYYCFSKSSLPENQTLNQNIKPIQNNSNQQNSDNQNPAFSLDFFAGGNIYFTEVPLGPDQASYRIAVSLDRKDNTIFCSILPPAQSPLKTA